MTAKTKNEALRKPAPATIQIQQATRSARRRSIFWYWLAGACALGAAGEAVAGLFDVGGAALLRWQILMMVLILAFLAVLFKWAGWSAGRYVSAVEAGRFVREQQKVRAAHQGLYLFLGFIALTVLTVVGLAWSWVAAGFSALLLLLPTALMILRPVNAEFWPDESYEEWGYANDGFFDEYGMMLGPDDSVWAGDGLLAPPSFGDDDL